MTRVWQQQFVHSMKILYNGKNNFKNLSKTVYGPEKITTPTKPIKGKELWHNSFLQIKCQTIHIFNYLQTIWEDPATFY
jgi:hypothetical protein